MLNPRCFFQFQLDDVAIAKSNDKGARIQRVPHNASDQSISTILPHDECVSSCFVSDFSTTFHSAQSWTYHKQSCLITTCDMSSIWGELSAIYQMLFILEIHRLCGELG